jgi:hypothetical protein
MSEQTESPRLMTRAAIAGELRRLRSRIGMLARSLDATGPVASGRRARPPKHRPTETKLSANLRAAQPAEPPKPKAPFRLGAG